MAKVVAEWLNVVSSMCGQVKQKEGHFSIRCRMVSCLFLISELFMSLHFPHAHPPAAGELTEVADGVFWLRMPLPFQLDHINLWLLRDGAGWVIVDTGFPDDAVRSMWASILARLEGPVTRLVVTHFHPDHLGLASWLQAETKAPLWMTSGEFLTAHAVWNEVGGHGARFMVEQFRQHGLDAEHLAKFEKRGSGYRKAVPSLPDHYHRLKAGDSLTVDGRIWRILIGYGHAPEHMALYCAELDVLISGDMLLPRISTNISVFAATPDADALRWYLESLDVMAAEIPDRTLVLPSHGLPFRGVQSRVAALHGHHAERLQALEDSCEKAPKSAAELLDVLFNRALDTHQTMFAMGEAIAHLNYLEQAGRLSRSTDADGVIRYSRLQHRPTAH
jgi:glyoxylase-like metal-dependent hydrolase (beta-lactamase superfamily II)